MERAVGEGVAVDHEQRAAARRSLALGVTARPDCGQLERRDRLAQPLRGGLCRLRDVERCKILRRDRVTVGDADRTEAPEPVGAHDSGRDERHAGLERDPCGARVPARLVALAHPLRPTRSFGEHHHRVALAAQRDRRVDRLLVALPAVDSKPPPAWTTQPSGGQKSSFFAMKRR